MRPRASVIMTSYNYARFIGEAVQSVLEQSWRDFELIVVDDGSTDETRLVLDRFGDAITCLYQENQGKSAALNRGLAAARGEIIAFLDSDDVWVSDSLAVRMAALETHPEAGVVYGRAAVMDEAGRLLPYTLGAPARYPHDTFLSLLTGVFVYFLTFMVRRDCLRQAGEYFDPSFGTTNDWELYLRLSRVCDFNYLDRVLACYRVHSSNWSGNPAVMAEEMPRVIDRALSAEDVPAGVLEAKPTIYRNLYTSIGLGFAASGSLRQAFRYFGMAARASRNSIAAWLRIAYLLLAGYAQRTRPGAKLVRAVATSLERRHQAEAARK